MHHPAWYSIARHRDWSLKRSAFGGQASRHRLERRRPDFDEARRQAASRVFFEKIRTLLYSTPPAWRVRVGDVKR